MRVETFITACGMAIISLLFLSAPASASCTVAVTFSNSGEETLILLPHHAATRTHLGHWRAMWPDAEPVEIGAGEIHVREWESRRCQPDDRRAFEFHMERGDCRPPGMARPDMPVLPGRDEEIDPARIVTLRWPDDGFRQLQPGGAAAGAPIQPSGDGGLAQTDERMRLEAPDLAPACAAAREG